MTDDGFETQSLPRRPGSSRYRILPSIGQMSQTEARADEPRAVLERRKAQSAEPSDQENIHARVEPPTKSHSRVQQNHAKVAGKHSSSAGSRVNDSVGDAKSPAPLVDQLVALAVKLPSGQRIEHQFQCTQKLSDILHYVEMVAQQDFTDCEFVSADRRTVLTDLNLTVASSGILNRSVLYLQLPDET